MFFDSTWRTQGTPQLKRYFWSEQRVFHTLFSVLAPLSSAVEKQSREQNSAHELSFLSEEQN